MIEGIDQLVAVVRFGAEDRLEAIKKRKLPKFTKFGKMRWLQHVIDLCEEVCPGDQMDFSWLHMDSETMQKEKE